MTKLLSQQAQGTYIGLFTKPAFALYSQSEKLFSGLFDIFVPYQVSLSDIRNTSSSLNPADQVISIYFGQVGDFKFKFDRVEATIQGEQDFKILPDILKRTDEWLRSAVPEFSFQTHLFSFVSHNKLSDKTSKEFLLGLSEIDIPDIGTSEGSGIIFHWDIPEQHWRVQLSIDHSATIPDGLFIQFLVKSEIDKVDYMTTLQKIEELLLNALSKIGLEGPGEN